MPSICASVGASRCPQPTPSTSGQNSFSTLKAISRVASIGRDCAIGAGCGAGATDDSDTGGQHCSADGAVLGAAPDGAQAKYALRQRPIAMHAHILVCMIRLD